MSIKVVSTIYKKALPRKPFEKTKNCLKSKKKSEYNAKQKWC